MGPLDAAALIILLALPLHWLVMRQLDRDSDPAWLREHGIIIVSERALQAHSAPIGRYHGRPIWATVTFKGMVYRFDRIIEGHRRERLEARELFLEPGLVYVTD
jgi:hypothetical protein